MGRVIIDMKSRPLVPRWPGIYRACEAILNAVTSSSERCGATDAASLVGDGPEDLDEPYGRCTLDAGHDGDWHQEWRDGRLRAAPLGPHPGTRCGVCGRDGAEH